MYALTDKMQRDKDFFLLIILVMVVAWVFTASRGAAFQPVQIANSE
jgi:hypothetical protein